MSNSKRQRVMINLVPKIHEKIFPELIPFLRNKCMGEDVLLIINSYLPCLASRLHPRAIEQHHTERIELHCHLVVNHLKGTVCLGETPQFKSKYQDAYQSGRLSMAQHLVFKLQRLTGIANWILADDELIVRMDSMKILPFWCKVFFTSTQTRQLREKKEITGRIKVIGRITNTAQRLIASVTENNILQIQDELNLDLWIETPIVLWERIGISSWDYYLQQVQCFEQPLPKVDLLELKREKEEKERKYID